MMSEPERDAVEVPARCKHHQGDHAEHDRHREPDHDPGAPAEAQQADREHDAERLQQRAFELPDGVADHGRLIGHALEFHAIGQLGLDLGHGLLHHLTQLDDIAVVGHHDAEHQHLLPVVPHGVSRRIFVSTHDRREVAELDLPTAGGDRHVADVLQALELPAHAHEHAVAVGVDRTACLHAVLVPEALGDRQRRDPERGQPLVRELDVDLLGLLAVDVDLLDHRHLEEPPLDVFGHVGQFPLTDAVALDGVEQPGHVAVLVVEDRADDAFGKLELDVAELLAHLVPRLALVRVGGATLHGDRHAAITLTRIGHDLLEVVELLELLLHPVHHLVLDLLRGGAGPDHDRRHRRHREVGVFELAEFREGHGAADDDGEHQEEHQGAVTERPFGEVE